MSRKIMVTMTSLEDPISTTENCVQSAASELVSEKTQHDQSPCSILVIDSNKVWRVIIRKILRHLNVEIFESDGPEEAVEVALECRPDLMIIDLDHPNQNSAEGILNLRAEALLTDTPIIITSEKVDRATISRLAKAQVKFALLKPYDEADLLFRVERIMCLKEKLKPGEVT